MRGACNYSDARTRVGRLFYYPALDSERRTYKNASDIEPRVTRSLAPIIMSEEQTLPKLVCLGPLGTYSHQVRTRKSREATRSHSASRPDMSSSETMSSTSRESPSEVRSVL